MKVWTLRRNVGSRKGGRRGRALRILIGSLLSIALLALAVPGWSAMNVDPPFGGPGPEANVEFNLPNRAAADELIAQGADLVEYVRDEPDGTITINAWVTPAERLYIESLGYPAGRTVEDQSTYEARMAERQAAIDKQELALHVAEGGTVAVDGTLLPGTGQTAGAEAAQAGEVTVMRADYFSHRSGTFLSVEARTSLGTPGGGPTMAMSWREETGAYGTATSMSKFTDAGQYMYHRILVRIGPAGATSPVPFMVQVASSTPASSEKLVAEWVGRDLPPLADGYIMERWDHYADPVEVYNRIDALAAEFPNISEIINLPYQTEGYQRKSMAVMAGAGAIDAAPANTGQAVLLIAKRYGQLGGNDTQAEFLLGIPPPGTPTVVVTGDKITVNLSVGTTAIEVVNLINNNPAASALVTAYTYAGNAGTGVVQPRLLVNLDDFLDAPPAIPRGHFQPRVIRIGTPPRDGSKVGVFLFCQEHAREWVTPLVCAETAERLLRNYAIDPVTQALVDNLDIFILPSYNPDGSLYSFYDFASQRKNMTRYCSLTASNGMPASQNSWGVDLNRNLSVGTLFDGYSGATSSCTGETYAGPSEVSEPETKNEQWLVDTFQNIKFSNNIHTYGGYFMWSPGAYVTPGRVTLPAPNIGIEAYFFEGADDILTRIKEYRGTAILPGRTGPVADVLYSAAGNSADDQWYRRNILAFSFEAGADLFTSDQTGTTQSAVGFMPAFSPEGFGEYNEFAAGNLGLLEQALQYANDTEPPVSSLISGDVCQLPVTTTFNYVNEPSVIHYTTDGSTPDLGSTTWEAQGPRRPGEEFTFTEPTTLKWIAVDIKGNVSPVQSQSFGQGCTDLALTKVGPAGRSPTGRNMTYTLTVINNGPTDALGVVVTDALPASVTFVSATSSLGTCSGTATVSCLLGTLVDGGLATIDIVVRPSQVGTITNTASVTASSGELIPGDNTASVDTNICRITSRRSSIPCG